MRRGIEMVDFACGAPTLLQGRTLRGVSGGIDQDYYRYALGVVGGIVPFNFPIMIPLWMFPLAVVSGNTFVLKPSERTALGADPAGRIVRRGGLSRRRPEPGPRRHRRGQRPARGARACGQFHSSAPSRWRAMVYQEGARHAKRVQAAGGAKNHIFVLPDADWDLAIPALINSAFGNAGERCLAGSVAVAVGEHAGRNCMERLEDAAANSSSGPATNPEWISVRWSPTIIAAAFWVISSGPPARARGWCLTAGRTDTWSIPGFFVGPTILDQVTPAMAAGREEIFGPVLSVSHVVTSGRRSSWSIASAAGQHGGGVYRFGTRRAPIPRTGRMRDDWDQRRGGAAVGFLSFQRMEGLFYGDLHLQGSDGIDFYTRKKIVVSRW